MTTGAETVSPLLISARELAKLLTVSERTVWRMVSSGTLIEPIRLAGNTRWRYDDVQSWIAEGCPEPSKRNN